MLIYDGRKRSPLSALTTLLLPLLINLEQEMKADKLHLGHQTH